MFCPKLSLLAAVAMLSSTMAEIAVTASASNDRKDLFDLAKFGMLGSIRTSWEQGTAAGGLLEYEYPEYSVFGANPFGAGKGRVPVQVLQMALSTVVRQTSDGRLSQNVGDALDGATMDGASAGSVVLLGALTDASKDRRAYFQTAADKQLAYLEGLNRTASGAMSQRVDEVALWADAVYMGPPFLAYYGAVSHNQSLLLEAFDQCRLYRDALILPGPTGKLWGHIYSETKNKFLDSGLWATGNAWAALGMLRVAVTITKSSAAEELSGEASELFGWVNEILNGTFAAIGSDNLIPDYIAGNKANFGDASASAALASVAYRMAVQFPEQSSNYTGIADKIRGAITSGIEANGLGMLTSAVDPLNWTKVGALSTEGQAFTLMMYSAWKAWKQ